MRITGSRFALASGFGGGWPSGGNRCYRPRPPWACHICHISTAGYLILYFNALLGNNFFLDK